MKQLDQAINILKQGGVVVYPTDTAYGLAVDATNVTAVKKLYALKGRDFKKPVHVIVPFGHHHTVVYDSEDANRLMKKFWPGPLTIILPLKARGKAWQILSAGTKTLGIRYPDNSTAQALVEAFKKPITTTSANLSGKGICYSIAEVRRQFRYVPRYVPIFYLDGGKLPNNPPSTVVSLLKGVRILRVGSISETEIKKVI